MSRTLKVTGNHVMHDRGAWFLRVIMSSSRALCCLPSVKKQKHDFFFFFQRIIKQLLDSVFVISRIIKVEVRVISRSRRVRLITLTSTLIILDITKTSSNNCLIISTFVSSVIVCSFPRMPKLSDPIKRGQEKHVHVGTHCGR